MSSLIVQQRSNHISQLNQAQPNADATLTPDQQLNRIFMAALVEIEAGNLRANDRLQVLGDRIDELDARFNRPENISCCQAAKNCLTATKDILIPITAIVGPVVTFVVAVKAGIASTTAVAPQTPSTIASAASTTT